MHRKNCWVVMAEATAQEDNKAQTSYTRTKLQGIFSRTCSCCWPTKASRLRSATKVSQLCPHWLERDAFLGQVPNAAPGKRAGSRRTGSHSFWQGSIPRDSCEGHGVEPCATSHGDSRDPIICWGARPLLRVQRILSPALAGKSSVQQ